MLAVMGAGKATQRQRQNKAGLPGALESRRGKGVPHLAKVVPPGQVAHNHRRRAGKLMLHLRHLHLTGHYEEKY